MRPLLHEIQTAHSPESLVERLAGELGGVLLRSALFESPQARYSFVAARPFLTLRAFGSRCELTDAGGARVQFGDPWRLLDALMARCELLEEVDLPFPLGGCFGFWGYDLKNFVEPRLTRRAVNDLELPDCYVGFHDSLVVFDHRLGKTWIVSTGLRPDGSRDAGQARRALAWWQGKLEGNEVAEGLPPHPSPLPLGGGEGGAAEAGLKSGSGSLISNLSRPQFIENVSRAQRYIRAGDIYQVNLAQRLAAPTMLRGRGSVERWGERPREPLRAEPVHGWDFFQRLSAVSPAPFSAFIDCGDFQIASSSPEMFLRLSGPHIITRPIKGTRPRSADPTRDAQLTYELQTSPKEMAELVMITDLLRNDLGRVCEFGSVQVPELVRLERYPHVQHLVSTVEGRLRPGVTHFEALAKCFPGGSITGAPKIRAMEIIDELEPVTRGPYTGCIGYLGFNRESQLNIAIRTAVCRPEAVYFHVGAGIVADSVPELEAQETRNKARAALAAIHAARSHRRRG